MDWPLVLIAALLAATVSAYGLGILPYPVGLLVLIVLLILRIRKLKTKKRD